MNRRKLMKSLATILLADYLGSLHQVWAAGNKLPPPGIQRIKGEVKVNGQSASEGMRINPGDTIITGSGSEVIYVIGNDAYLQRDQSVVSISADLLKGGLRILSGKLMSVFGKGNKQLQTSTATIGIRGTGCYIEASPEKVYFCLCYGIAEVAPLSHPEKIETIETSHHDHPVYLYANGEKMMVPAEVVNHSDSELILLESLVGRLPPFYGKASHYH
jgi:hypothetical protein